MRKNPHVRICGGLGSATTLVYPTATRRRRPGPSPSWRLSRTTCHGEIWSFGEIVVSPERKPSIIAGGLNVSDGISFRRRDHRGTRCAPEVEVSGGVNLDRQAYVTWDQAREAELQHAGSKGVDVWTTTHDGMRLVRKFRTSS